MRILGHDLRFGLRILKNAPWFTVVAVLTLAVGIAVNTTVFGWIDAVLLNPLPGARDTHELAFAETATAGGEHLVGFSYLDYRDYRDNLTLVSGLAVARHTPLSVGADGRAQRAWGELVSGNYFDVLRVRPYLGRTFLREEADEKTGAFPVAVISHRMWLNRFSGDPSVLGRSIRINRNELTVVGVTPPGFRGSRSGLAYDVWIPVTMATAMGTGGGTLNFRGTRDLTTTIARLKPGVSIEQAGAEVSALARRLAAAHPRTNRGIDAALTPVWRSHGGAQGVLLQPLRILMAVGLILFLIVCANVANLLLARAVSRQKEFGIRLAMGAGRWRLARQMLTETLLLAAAGAVAGVILSLWLGQSLAVLLPPTMADGLLALDADLSARTLGFAVLLAFAVTLVSGMAPALLPVRSDLSESLKEGGRGGTSSARSHRLRGLLVVSEVALASIALIGAGLFARSFRNATTIQPGFDMANVSVSQFYLSYSGYSAQEQRQFCRSLRERLERIPGVVGVSYSDQVPLVFGGTPLHQLEVEGYIPAQREDMTVHRSLVPPGYFDLLRIPVLEGRDFTEQDEAGSPDVIIVNEAFARRYFGGASPIGRKVRVESRWTSVVGMVKDTKIHTPMEAPFPFFYRPFRQVFAPGLNFAFFVKTTADPLSITEVLRREALSLNQDAVFSATLLEEAASASLYPLKIAAVLLGVLSGVSVLLAAIGLYSVMSYAVSQRIHEVGVRMAVGARPANVLGLVLRQAMALALPGLALGAAGAAASVRLASGMLVNVSAADPLTFGAAAGFLTVVAVTASTVPALRAARVDPVAALRCE